MMERKEDIMRYFDDENDYPYDYEHLVENAEFDDIEEYEDEGDCVNIDNIQEWENYYHNIADELVDE